MSDAKPIRTPLTNHLKLSKKQCPRTIKEKYFKVKVPYALAIESLMYVIVGTRPNVAHWKHKVNT